MDDSLSGDDAVRAVVESAREGNEDAWRVLFDRHYTSLYRFFRSRVSTHAQAEDLASSVFLEAFRSIRRFQWRGKPFEAWLFGIARHELASYYRSRPKSAPPPAEFVRDEFVAVEVRDILDRLTPDHRTALELRYVLGLSGEEAAAVMNRSHGSFRSLLLRAVRAYRRESDVAESRPARGPLRRYVGELALPRPERSQPPFEGEGRRI